MKNVKIFLSAVTVVFAASIASAAPDAPIPRPPVSERPAPAQPVDESIKVSGVIESIDQNKRVMKIKGSDGQQYIFPITKSVDGRDPKVGQKANIKVRIHCCPWEITIEVTF